MTDSELDSDIRVSDHKAMCGQQALRLTISLIQFGHSVCLGQQAVKEVLAHPLHAPKRRQLDCPVLDRLWADVDVQE